MSDAALRSFQHVLPSLDWISPDTHALFQTADPKPARMSANSLFMKSGWITANAPLRNGVGRFVPQLARITIKFCKEYGGSNGVSEYITY